VPSLTRSISYKNELSTSAVGVVIAVALPVVRTLLIVCVPSPMTVPPRAMTKLMRSSARLTGSVPLNNKRPLETPLLEFVMDRLYVPEFPLSV